MGVAAARDLIAPIFLDAVDETDDAAVVALVGIGAGLAVLYRRRAIDRRTRRGVVGERIHAEQERHDQDDKPDAAAADDDRSADAASESAASSLIFDLRGVKRRATTKRHVLSTAIQRPAA